MKNDQRIPKQYGTSAKMKILITLHNFSMNAPIYLFDNGSDANKCIYLIAMKTRVDTIEFTGLTLTSNLIQ